ncbi:DUF3021 domain-containing protein [Companilactobacillus mishanensis]|uniref:DUF3021 domain-containing protein n=1 Tax=Companilactobacillus mishanensis TaxID=2486008 RepID=A0ABW9P635_9LACO|nr:DUF3021 domain-containing protein [Companilactobacillus mishanensis]MQS44698.1 DUF3021 domain-containing protein [Companilactobacillus mishanensis]
MKTFNRYFIVGFKGIFIGIAIGFLMSLLFSFIYKTPTFVPSSSDFYLKYSNLRIATGISTLLWAGMGLVFSFASLVFRVDKWSITKRTIVNFVITFFGFTPLAILAGWFPSTAYWYAFYVVTFLITYTVMWIISMNIARSHVREINERIQQLNGK